MNVLFVVDQYPFPARNGVTIPTSNLIRGLAEMGYKVHVLVLVKSEKYYNQFNGNTFFHKNVKFSKYNVISRGKYRSALSEAFLRKMFFCPELPNETVAGFYDIVIASPIMPVCFVAELKKKSMINFGLFIAVISDVYSSLMRRKLDNAIMVEKNIANILVFAYRSFVSIPRLEYNLLKDCDYIAVQTKRDQKWLKRIGGKRLLERALILPNGVNKELFDLPMDKKKFESTVLYIGGIDREMSTRLTEYIVSVHPYLRSKYPDYKFKIICSDPPENILYLSDVNDFDVINYVDSLSEVYSGAGVLLSPMFKGFGLINKVVEAMASGCVVVGDITSFNGIDGFENKVHAIVVKNVLQFKESIVSIFESPDYALSIKRNARTLIKEQFSWKDRYDKINDIITGVRL